MFFFLPLKLFSRSVFLSFYLSAFFVFLSFMSIHKSRFFFLHRLNIVKRNSDHLEQIIVHLFAIV